LAISYLVPLLISLVVFQVPYLRFAALNMTREALKYALWRAFISMNITFAVMFPLTMLFDQLLSTVPGSFNLFYWAILSFISLANLVAQYFINLWMIQRGFFFGPLRVPAQELTNTPLNKKSVWPVWVTSLVIMISALAITIFQLA
jgi:hypothetical protein